MKKTVTLTIITLLWCNYVLFAQNKYEGNYNVLLKSGTISFEANLNEFATTPIASTSEIINGYAYKFLQFKTIPDVTTLQQLQTAGILLFDYVPHKTYLAGIPMTTNFHQLKKFGVRSIQNIAPEYKLAPEVVGPVYPEWAEKGNKIEVIISYFKNISATTIQTLLHSNQITLVRVEQNSNTAVIQVDKAKIMTLAALPFIYFIEPTYPPAVPEDDLGKSLHRSNVINTLFPSGKHYNGQGVNVLTRDDGEIGPHIDFHNRTNQNAAPATDGTHGDGVAGIIAGAGNLNPTIAGMAPNAFMYVIDYTANYNNDNTLQLHQNDNVVITNSSYSDGCNGGYTTTARVVDEQSYFNPTLLHVFSGGNSNNSDCGYGAGTQWGNITGGHKIGKNVIATANLFADGSIVSSSSRGPAQDGRLKPDISANGQEQLSISTNNTYQSFGGTSGAAPGIAGVAAQLYQAYRELNNGVTPNAALIKAALLNSAEDYGNYGPDFIYGWGRVNAYRALEVIENNQYLSGTITQNASNNHTINVPAGVKTVKVMTYWIEPPAAVNAAMALTNDLDMSLTTPTGQTYLPWVLNPAPNPTTLNAPAIRSIDNLNNAEQVTLENPASGTYTVTVNAPVVPNGNVSYYVITTYIYNEITVTYPIGGEGLVPNTVERIHWDASGNQASFLIQMTTDGGNTWYTVANVSGNERMYDWTVPNFITGRAKIQISRGTKIAQSQANFSILGTPQNIHVTKVCPTSIRIEWDALAGATAYDVFILGYQYMDSIATTTNNYYEIPVTNPIAEHWFSVRGVGANGLRGRRANAVQYIAQSLVNCYFNNDVALSKIASPSGYLSNCSNSILDVTVEITNNSNAPKSNFGVSYQFNGTTINETFTNTLAPQTSILHTFSTPINVTNGNYTIKAWTNLANEDFYGNDTSTTAFNLNAATLATLPIIENFDAFSSCGTTSNCGLTTCALGNSWLNLTNGTDDDIDFRVDANGVPSQNTGPTSDHTTGAGNYIYLESSTCYNQEAILLSPCIDLTTANIPQLTFWYSMNGATMGELHIDLYDGTQWIENVIPAIIGNQGTAWKQGVVNLQPFVGNIINIRFRGITGSSFTSDLALDDINISEVTAAPIAAFTTSTNNTCTNNAIQLTDASINIPQTWSWQITPATFNYVNNTNATTGNPVVVFNATGIYTVQLTVTNTNGQDSLTQTNLINVANGGTIPYIENFNAFSFPNPAISLQNPDNGDTWETVTTVGSDGSSTQALYVNNFNYNAVGEEDALVLTFDLTNETAATLKFDVAHARYSGTYSDGIRIDAYTDCGNTFASTLYNKSGAALATAPDQTTTFSPNSAAQWRNETVDLSNFIGNIVTLKIINVCGYGNNTYLDNINIDTTSIIPVTLQANITRSGGDYCVGMPVTFYNNSIGTNLTYNWDFGTNATPSTATTAGPHNVTYNSNGLQTAKLTITDSNGDKDSTSATVFVSGIAVANFNLIQQNDSTIKLFYGGLYTNTFQWYFGDGNVSTVQNPLYTYDSSGTFTVSLIVQGDCGDDTLTQDVIIQLVNTNNIFNTAENITVFPNPTNGIFQITINGLKEKANLKLIDVQGRIIKTWNTESTATILQKNLDITEVPSGIYFLHIQTDKSSDIIKLLKE